MRLQSRHARLDQVESAVRYREAEKMTAPEKKNQVESVVKNRQKQEVDPESKNFPDIPKRNNSSEKRNGQISPYGAYGQWACLV